MQNPSDRGSRRHADKGFVPAVGRVASKLNIQGVYPPTL